MPSLPLQSVRSSNMSLSDVRPPAFRLPGVLAPCSRLLHQSPPLRVDDDSDHNHHHDNNNNNNKKKKKKKKRRNWTKNKASARITVGFQPQQTSWIAIVFQLKSTQPLNNIEHQTLSKCSFSCNTSLCVFNFVAGCDLSIPSSAERCRSCTTRSCSVRSCSWHWKVVTGDPDSNPGFLYNFLMWVEACCSRNMNLLQNFDLRRTCILSCPEDQYWVILFGCEGRLKTGKTYMHHVFSLFRPL